MEVGRYGDLLMSLVLEVIGRTTCDREDRKEAMVSEPERERPPDDGVLDSIDVFPLYSLPWTLIALGFFVSCISEAASGVDSGWYVWICC